MGIIAWLVLGLASGLLANMLIPGRRSQGLILTCLIRVAGPLGGHPAVPRPFRRPAWCRPTEGLPGRWRQAPFFAALPVTGAVPVTVALPVPARTWMRLARTSGALGTKTCRTPSWAEAWILSA